MCHVLAWRTKTLITSLHTFVYFRISYLWNTKVVQCHEGHLQLMWVLRFRGKYQKETGHQAELPDVGYTTNSEDGQAGK